MQCKFVCWNYLSLYVFLQHFNSSLVNLDLIKILTKQLGPFLKS